MARKPKFDYDLIVIGSGAAGSTTALAVAKKGKKVALIEDSVFGGESPNWGDIPTAALLHAAHIYSEARHASRFGLRTTTLSYNFPLVMQWRDKVIKRTGAADNEQYYRKFNIDTHSGIAYFLSPHEISVNRKRFTAEQFVIATGARFKQPDVYGIETIHYKTPKTILASKRIPKSLCIVGSNSEAIEFAQLFATFGTKVYIIEKSSRLMPKEDSEVGELMERFLAESRGITCLTHTQITSVEPKGLGVRLSYAMDDAHRTIQIDELLFTDNREPNVDLGLDNAVVGYTPAGIEVNDALQTTAKHIYAGGSVVLDDCPTQVALLHGKIIAHNILNKNKSAEQPAIENIPRITFSSPEVASVGLGENDCIKRDLRVDQAIVPLTLIPRSNTSDTSSGFVKIIADKKGDLRGGTIVAPHAAEMIQELSLAIHQGMLASDLADTPHAFLSWSEAVRVAAQKLG